MRIGIRFRIQLITLMRTWRRIRMRIQVIKTMRIHEDTDTQTSVVDPYSFFPDPDPDPEFDVGDPYGSGFRIRIQYGSRALMTKNWKKITPEKKVNFFLSKTAIYLSLGLHKVCPGYRRSLQLTKEAIQHFKTWIFSTFVGHSCPPGSGSGSVFKLRIRIRIQWSDWIRIQYGYWHKHCVKNASPSIFFLPILVMEMAAAGSWMANSCCRPPPPPPLHLFLTNSGDGDGGSWVLNGEQLLQASASTPAPLHVEQDVLWGEGGAHQAAREAGRHHRLRTLSWPTQGIVVQCTVHSVQYT